MDPETENSACDEPSVPPNFRLSPDVVIHPRSRGGSDASMKQPESSRHSKDELTFVRSIYVYTASKIAAEDDIILSQQHHRPASSHFPYPYFVRRSRSGSPQ